MLGVIYVACITSLLRRAYYSECATNANEQALIDSEDEIGSLEDLLEEEMRVALKNVQPSSCAALRNAKRALNLSSIGFIPVAHILSMIFGNSNG